jgi:hypothetical protein
MVHSLAAGAVIEATRDLARSALPDAPVRRDPQDRCDPPTPDTPAHAAAALRRLADRLEPIPRLSARTRTS